MNRSQRTQSNAANAILALDCPWCAEPLRRSAAELDAGLACDACGIETPWADAPAQVERLPRVPLAA